MPRAALCLMTVLLLNVPFVSGAAPVPFSKQAEGAPELVQSGPDRHWCPVCGMKLAMFYKTSHAAHLHDGSARQYCSIRCLAVDLERLGAGLARVSVVDAESGKLIPAATATYVVESDVPGTMSAVSKLAFADEAAAEAFRTTHQGRLATYDEALALARASLAADGERLRTKKRLKVHPMGRKLWETVCKRDVDPHAFESVARLKAALATADDGAAGCPGLPEPKLQAVALYLWDVVRGGATQAAPIVVPDGAKCPVCGMFVAKYPHWVAVYEIKGVETGDGKTPGEVGAGETLYFDGVKDLMKYALAPERSARDAKADVRSLTVSDYYTLGALDAREAFYVVGSAVRGPMGHELVPFRSAAQAETFRADHGGRVLRFEEITTAVVEELDARK